MPVDAVRGSRAKGCALTVCDWVWPTLRWPSGNLRGDCETLNPEIKVDATDDVVREVYARLSAELEDESERRRAVENKLLASGSVAPIAVTIMAAAVTFLSSGRLREFVPVSVIVVSVMASYVAVQFLCAMLAAIRGLSRMPYDVSSIPEIMSHGAEDLNGYLRQASSGLARRIAQHRKTTNMKVSHLAVAHQSMRNAVIGLVGGLVILVVVTVSEACGTP